MRKKLLWKRDGDTIHENDDGSLSYLPSWTRQNGMQSFNDVMLRKADEPRSDDDIERTNTEDDDIKVSDRVKELVAAMIAAAPSLHPQRAARWLLHTDQGRALLSTTKKEEPQMDILKLIAITEDGLMAQVTKRDDETYAKAFSRKFENDISFREQWRDLTDAKHLQVYLKSLAMAKDMASLEPTSTEVGNTNVSDDSAEAVRLLGEMAEKNGRSFELSSLIQTIAPSPNAPIPVHTGQLRVHPAAQNCNDDWFRNAKGKPVGWLDPFTTGRPCCGGGGSGFGIFSAVATQQFPEVQQPSGAKDGE